MKNIEITHKEFEGSIHSSEKIESSHKAEYLYYDVDIFSELSINDKKYQINYQAGEGFYNNDYNCPIETIYLSIDGYCNTFIYFLDNLSEEELHDESFIKEFNDKHDENYSVSEIIQISRYVKETLYDEATDKFNTLKEIYNE